MEAILTPNPKCFKDYFKAARLKKGLQQKDVAQMLDVVPAYISRLEKGFSLPSNDLLFLACERLGLDGDTMYLQVQSEKTENGDAQAILERLIERIQAGGESLEVTPEDAEIARKVAKLTPKGKEAVKAVIGTLPKKDQE